MSDTFDIAAGRRSTVVHAAPGGVSSFSLAHDSFPAADGMTPRELANLRKAERQKEADRAYLESTRDLTGGNNKFAGGEGTVRTAAEHTSSNIFDDPAPMAPPKQSVDIFELSAPFGSTNDPIERPSTRVQAAPGGQQTLVLGSDSPTWGNKSEHFDKPKPCAAPRASGTSHPEMARGSQMASLLGGSAPLHEVGAQANVMDQPAPTSAVTKAHLPAQDKTDGPPDTSNMSHKERIAAMKQYRLTQENGGMAIAPAVTKQVTAGRNDGVQHTTENSMGDRPSSRVLAPPGGKSNFTFG
eukprot:CAMPEP_0185190976 /NCGR_PEP_ID=MMETSP1140-20130426/13321_1 /TAXON_ID=298111 /ORGANISM="Pavlova sp., Strain CCMP459" /LENGTH=297 /DNA_ID=CAMNT_0027757655 /DNA_START=43 /DNA_END=936 /DNA_ORIENTATION=+